MQFKLPFNFGRTNPTSEISPTSTDTARLSTSSSPTSNPSAPSSNFSSPRQSGITNFQKFTNRFSLGGSSSASGRTSITKEMIGAKTALGNQHYQPKPEELIPGIETLTKEAIDRNDCSKALDWDKHVEEHPDLADNIRALQHDLQWIDALTADDIRAERSHWYGLIARSKEKNTPKYQQEAKEATKQTKQERYFTFGQAARDMKAARHAQRAQLIEDNEKTGTQQFVDSFRNKVEKDIERGFTGRFRNIKKKCVEHLQKNLQEGMPLQPLLEVVAKVSPEAVDEFRKRKSWAFSASSEEVTETPLDLAKYPQAELAKVVAEHGKEPAGLKRVTVVGKKAETRFVDLTTSRTHDSTVRFFDLQDGSRMKDFLQGSSLDDLDSNGKL